MTSAQLAKLALDHVTKVLDKLSDEQLQALATGRGWFEFRSEEVVVKSPKTRAALVEPTFDVNAAADEIRGLDGSAAITAYLDRRNFKTADLKAIAIALGPTVSTKGRTLAQLKTNIVEGVAGFRERAAAIGGWGRQ